MHLGLVGVSDGHELEAALAAKGLTVAGFWGEDAATLAALADYHGLVAASDWRELAAADALYLGAGLCDPAGLLADPGMAEKPLLLAPALLARQGAVDWLTALAAASAPVGLALDAAVDDGLAYCRSLARAGVLGKLLGVQVCVSSAEAGEAAWAPLADALGTALWASDLAPVSASWSGMTEGEALWLSALLQTEQGAPVSVTLLRAVPGGAHDDLLAPRLLGTRGQLILAREPLGWFTAASESNTSQRWEEVVYAGQRGSLARSLEAFAAAVQAHEPPPLPLAAELPLAGLLAAMQAAPITGAWTR